MKFPTKMADEIKKEYLDYFNKLKNDVENNRFATWSKLIKIKIDLSDLPEQYHPNKLEEIAKKFFNKDYIMVEFNGTLGDNNITSGWSHRIDSPKTPMIIHTQIKFKDIQLANYEATIEHELTHLIQMLLAIYIKEQGSKTNEYFVGYPFKDSIKDFDKYWKSEDVQKILTRKRKKNKSEINKKDFKHELSLIEPMEFYPHITSAKYRLLKNNHITKGIFKRFVGMTSLPGDFFFENLKKHNKKMWTKAVKILWVEIKQSINF